ncbi:MAG: glycosyltransferase family 4 protein [Acidobacteriota bacterium]|nr:MAG: glycosyltransferase family 4 protein [Acidobacteriota bacterium]
MKVLIVSLYYDPDLCQANGPIIRALCNDLTDAGHEVTVLTSFPHYNCRAVWPEYRRKLFQRDRVGKVRVIRSYIYVPRTRSIFGRILNYLSFNVTSTLAGLFTGRQDIIFVMSPPLTVGLTGFLLGLIKRIPYCYNLQDIWPEAAVRLGILRHPGVIRFFERLEKFIYRRSRRVFAISEEFKQNLIAKGIPQSKIEVIPNFVDTAFIRQLERDNPFSIENGLTDKFVALYAGNIGLSQGIEVILEAAEELRDREDILFLVVGQGIRRDGVVAEAARRGLRNIRFLPLQPEKDVPWLYASCDVALIPLKRDVTQTSLPCKTYSIMAGARAFIASVDEGSHVWRLAEHVGCGVCVGPEDGSALARAILKMKDNPQLASQMGLRGRRFVETHFSREANTTRYRVALEAIAEAGIDPVPDRSAHSTEPLGDERAIRNSTGLTGFIQD